ncbi:hypothetical protein BT96DRAFT_927010, partial [Gymnopus androsaceus JB14]
MSHSETASSILTSTGTLTSFIPGLGATSGTALKRVGSVVVNGVEAILIRRRISLLETIFKQNKLRPLKADYDDLLELSRSEYEPSIRKRAFRVIMGITGGMEFESLAFAVSEWHQDLSCDLLREITLCFRLEDNPEEINPLPSSFIQRQNADINAFLLFIALVISFSQTPSFSRMVIHELDMLTFITQTILNSDFDFGFGLSLLPAKLVFRALLEKLDPTVDSPDAPSYAQLQVLLSINAFNSISLVSESENSIRASILSRVRLGVNILSSKIDEKALHRQA